VTCAMILGSRCREPRFVRGDLASSDGEDGVARDAKRISHATDEVNAGADAVTVHGGNTGNGSSLSDVTESCIDAYVVVRDGRRRTRDEVS